MIHGNGDGLCPNPFLEQRVWSLVSPISTQVGDDIGIEREREREGPFVTSDGYT